MMKIPPMADMRRTAEEKSEALAPMTGADLPDYPYGLCISLTQDELEKLGLDDEELPEVGDMLHIHAMAKVISVSSSDNEAAGKCCRVELQITHMVGEDEDEENEEAEPPRKRQYAFG